MKVQKNECSACGYNFSREGLFFAHRVGLYPSENLGVSTRRCLTEAEMKAKGWLLKDMDVHVYDAERITSVKMLTWITPQYLHQLEDMSTRMSDSVRTKRH